MMILIVFILFLIFRWAVYLSNNVSSSRRLSRGLVFFNGCFTYYGEV